MNADIFNKRCLKRIQNILEMFLEVSQMIPLKTVYIVSASVSGQSSMILPWYWNLNGPATTSSLKSEMSLQLMSGGEWKSAVQRHQVEPWEWNELTGLIMYFSEEDAGSFRLYRFLVQYRQLDVLQLNLMTADNNIMQNVYGPAFVVAIEGIKK